MRGNSSPIVLQQGEEKFFVKLRGGMSGEFSLLSEWFGSVVGKHIGLNIHQPFWINLTNEIQLDNINIEIRELINKSFGRNIGFRFIDHVREISSSEILNYEHENLIDIFLYDIFMLNPDRTDSNTNLLGINEELVISDFDSSLLFNEIIKEKDISNNIRVLHSLRANPLYQKISDNRIELFINKLDQVPYHKIIDKIPDDILNDTNRKKIKEGLKAKKAKGWGIKIIMQKLNSTNLETDTTKNRRIAGNRERFEKLLNK